MKDFLDALKEMGPSITPDMEKWYKSFNAASSDKYKSPQHQLLRRKTVCLR